MNNELSELLARTLRANREALLRYSVLLDLCPLPAFFLEFNSKIPIYINPAYYELTGRTLDELQVQNWLQLVIHPEDLPGVVTAWNKFDKDKTFYVHWHRYVNASGLVTRVTAVLKGLPDSIVGYVLPKCDNEFECPIAKMNKLAPHS